MTDKIYFKDIDFCDGGEAYEWDEFHVLRGSDGKLYTGFAWGCSCNSFFDWYYISDNVPAGWELLDGVDLEECSSWIEACARIQAWAGYNKWAAERRQEAGMALIERLTNSKPAAFDPSKVIITDE